MCQACTCVHNGQSPMWGVPTNRATSSLSCFIPLLVFFFPLRFATAHRVVPNFSHTVIQHMESLYSVCLVTIVIGVLCPSLNFLCAQESAPDGCLILLRDCDQEDEQDNTGIPNIRSPDHRRPVVLPFDIPGGYSSPRRL